MNNSTGQQEQEEMAQTGKSWIFFVIIGVCVAITQVVAYFATTDQTILDGFYVLNILAASQLSRRLKSKRYWT